MFTEKLSLFVMDTLKNNSAQTVEFTSCYESLGCTILRTDLQPPSSLFGSIYAAGDGVVTQISYVKYIWKALKATE